VENSKLSGLIEVVSSIQHWSLFFVMTMAQNFSPLHHIHLSKMELFSIGIKLWLKWQDSY
jgi:hypothetical protein